MSSATWSVNAYVGSIITAGSSTATVVSNTATVLTVASWTGGTPTTGSFLIAGFAGFNYALRLQRTSGGTSTGGITIMQNVESNNSIPLAGKTATISFYARAGANFSSVNLTGVDLTGATLTGLSASSITGNPTLPTNWFISMGYLIGPNANLTGANLTGINLSNKYLVIINFTNANLTNANLAGANFNSANFSGADLSGAVLTGSDFSYANITNAIMATSLITGITYTGLVGGPPASLPTGWRWNVGQLIQG